MLDENPAVASTLTVKDFTTTKGNIASHKGRWNEDYKTHEVILPVPQTKTERFVHMIDYLASRKAIQVDLKVSLSPG